jgi:hypothetical protein
VFGAGFAQLGGGSAAAGLPHGSAGPPRALSIARLAALVPKPRVNLTRFQGVFARNSAHRARVTKAHRGKGATGQAAAVAGEAAGAPCHAVPTLAR